MRDLKSLCTGRGASRRRPLHFLLLSRAAPRRRGSALAEPRQHVLPARPEAVLEGAIWALPLPVPARAGPLSPLLSLFSWPELESGQNELLSGQNGPQLGKMFEKWAKLANNLEVGKKFIHDRCSVLLSDHCSFHSIALVHSSLCFHHACPWTQTTTDTLINSLHHRVRKAC